MRDQRTAPSNRRGAPDGDVTTRRSFINNPRCAAKTEMKTTRRTQIDIETHEITIIRGNGAQKRQYCDRCRRTVPVFEFDELTPLAQIAADDIRARLKAGTIHLASAGDKGGGICGNSVAWVLPARSK